MTNEDKICPVMSRPPSIPAMRALVILLTRIGGSSIMESKPVSEMEYEDKDFVPCQRERCMAWGWRCLQDQDPCECEQSLETPCNECESAYTFCRLLEKGS